MAHLLHAVLVLAVAVQGADSYIAVNGATSGDCSSASSACKAPYLVGLLNASPLSISNNVNSIRVFVMPGTHDFAAQIPWTLRVPLEVLAFNSTVRPVFRNAKFSLACPDVSTTHAFVGIAFELGSYISVNGTTNKAKLVVRLCTFTSLNEAVVVAADNTADMVLSQCTFSANSMVGRGVIDLIRCSGSLQIDRCRFSQNLRSFQVSEPLGSCVSTTNVPARLSVTISQCIFAGNTAGLGDAVAVVSIRGASSLNVTKVVFSRNTGTFGGAGVAARECGKMVVDTVLFEANVVNGGSAIEGGALYVRSNDVTAPTTLTMSRSTFRDNVASATATAGGFGGGFAMRGRVDATLSECSFLGNSAGGKGGAIASLLVPAVPVPLLSFSLGLFCNNTGDGTASLDDVAYDGGQTPGLTDVIAGSSLITLGLVPDVSNPCTIKGRDVTVADGNTAEATRYGAPSSIALGDAELPPSGISVVGDFAVDAAAILRLPFGGVINASGAFVIEANSVLQLLNVTASGTVTLAIYGAGVVGTFRSVLATQPDGCPVDVAPTYGSSSLTAVLTLQPCTTAATGSASSELSGGAIAGIVVGSVVGAAIVVAAVIGVIVHRRSSANAMTEMRSKLDAQK